jgi:predicted AAA+ superfamily ATPase
LAAYVHDAILEPAIGRDILALATIRKPALLRQVFGVATSSPAQIVSLQKLQSLLQGRCALETIASYLSLLEEAFLVAPLPKYDRGTSRRRAAPPKLITLNNALVAVMDREGAERIEADPKRFGSWVENACLAHAWNAGQHVSYWREEPLEIDGVCEGSWGSWALEVKTGRYQQGDLQALLEFVRRNPAFRPLVICRDQDRSVAERAGVAAVSWEQFLLAGPPGMD